MSEEEKITIPLAEYQRLCQVDLELSALECAGVDNWEGYGEARRMMAGWKEE